MSATDPVASDGLADAQRAARRWQWLAFTVVIGLLVWKLAPVLTPFAIAMFFGYLGDPLVDRLESWRMSRTFAVSTVFIAMITLAALAVFFLLPLLTAQVGKFVQQLPAYADWFHKVALPWVNARTGIDLAPYFDTHRIVEMLRTHWEQTGVASGVLEKMSHSGMVLIEVVSTIVLVPVLAFYFLRDWDVLVERIDSLLPRAIQPTVARLARESDEMLGGFLRGQLSVMVCLGTFYAIALWFVGLDLALLIGMVIGMLCFVPYLGVTIGIVLSLLAALVQYGDFNHVALVAGTFAVGQTLESFVLVPRLVGDKIGMHPVGVIFALMAGGQLFGFLGILLALPVSAIAMVLLRYGHERYTASRLYAGPQTVVVEETVSLIVVTGHASHPPQGDATPPAAP